MNDFKYSLIFLNKEFVELSIDKMNQFQKIEERITQSIE
jgi:hypothetical protein